jgi:shikimate kinase
MHDDVNQPTDDSGSPPVGRPPRHIVVLGQMGAGKTTLGRALAERLGRPFFDSDAEIEAREGRTGGEIAADRGVEALHRLEADIVAGFLERVEPSVVSAAASVVDTEEFRGRLRSGPFCLWIDVPAPILLERIHRGSHRRSVGIDDLRRLDRKRRPLFERVCRLSVDGTRSVEDQLDRVIAELDPHST